MNRRDFGIAVGSGVVGATVAATTSFAQSAQPRPAAERPAQPASGRKKAAMFASANGQATVEGMQFVARHGVFHVDCNPPKVTPGVGWDYADAMRQQEFCAKYNVKIESYHIPVDRSIMLGIPARDEHIKMMQQMIEVAGKAGIRALFYNTVLDGNLRTGFTGPDPKRGNVSYNTWDYQEALKRNEGLTEAGIVSVDTTYERIKYMLDRLIPVAEKYKVQLGNHPADPATHEGYRGITRWNSPDIFKGFQRFIAMYDSPYHGLNLCVGVTGESVKDPKTEVPPIVKWLGERNKVFNIHFRNIKGGWDHFMEVSVDDGDTDMVAVMRTLRDVGYQYGIQPDHTLRQPEPADPGAGQQYTAFVFGYIKALIAAVNSEA